MSRSGDYSSEMGTPEQIDDAVAEALFAGRPVGDEFEHLGWALRAYRGVARRPAPSPSGELAAWLASGEFGSAAAPHRPAVGIGNRRGLRAAATRKWRRVKMAVISGLAAAAAKLAGLSTAAKAGAGLSIALASVGTAGAAGAAGALPDPAQDRFDTVVEQVTGDQPEPAGDNSEFGERVSEDARDGGVDGDEISEEAKRQGEQRRPTQVPAPGEGAMPSELPTPDDPAGERPASRPDAPVERPSATPPAPPRP